MSSSSNSDETWVGATLHVARRGVHLWEDFDAGSVHDALSRMVEHGLELVRVPVVWEAFQPRAAQLPTRMLHHFVEVLDHAARLGLGVMPWLFVGPWMGMSQLPPWAVAAAGKARQPVWSGGRRRMLPPLDLWTDPAMLEAEARLVQEVSRAASGHPAIRSWEVAATPERSFGPAELQTRASWLRRHAEVLAQHGGGVPVGVSLDAADVPKLAPLVAVSVDWVGVVPSPRVPEFVEGPADPAWPAFLANLTRWLSGRPAILHLLGAAARPVETGTSKRLVEHLPTEEETARAAEKCLERLPLADTKAVIAEVWADAGPKLARLTPYDRDPAHGLRGLVRADGQPKPALEVFSRWARDTASQRAAPRAPVPDEKHDGPTAEQILESMGVAEAPKPVSSSLLALPGGADFERLSQELGFSKKPLALPGRQRGAAPEWADVEPGEVEADPDEHMPRLYRAFRSSIAVH